MNKHEENWQGHDRMPDPEKIKGKNTQTSKRNEWITIQSEKC